MFFFFYLCYYGIRKLLVYLVGGKMFLGFFKNADYSNPEVFLREGAQTKFIFNSCELANFKDECGDIKTDKDLFKIIKFIESKRCANLSKNYDQFSRTAKEIFNSGEYTGCTDFAIVFETITRQLGIPTVHVQLADLDWINELNQGSAGGLIRGHHACECYINNKWVYVDVAGGKIYGIYDKNNLKIDNRICFAKSLDVFETGIHTLKENNETMINLFLKC